MPPCPSSPSEMVCKPHILWVTLFLWSPVYTHEGKCLENLSFVSFICRSPGTEHKRVEKKAFLFMIVYNVAGAGMSPAWALLRPAGSFSHVGETIPVHECLRVGLCVSFNSHSPWQWEIAVVMGARFQFHHLALVKVDSFVRDPSGFLDNPVWVSGTPQKGYTELTINKVYMYSSN